MATASIALNPRRTDPHSPDAAPRWLLPLVAAAHIALLAWLASRDIVPLPAPLATLMVRVIAPAAPAAAPAADILPPKPVPLERKPAPRPQPASQPQILAAQTAALVPAVAQIVKEAPDPSPSPAIGPSPAVVSPPRFDADYLHNPAPVYPTLSRRLGEEGRVVLRVFVEPGGRPGRIEIGTSSGAPRLDQAAQEAVRRWQFVPARRGEEAVGAWVLVPVVFNLRG
jgi:protein TonB